MIRYYYYYNEIEEIIRSGGTLGAYRVLKTPFSCITGILCPDCLFANETGRCNTGKRKEWLNEEVSLFSDVNWEEVEVDTKVYVKNRLEERWKEAYFSHYKDGYIFVFIDGRTSFTEGVSVRYPYAKLAE